MNQVIYSRNRRLFVLTEEEYAWFRKQFNAAGRAKGVAADTPEEPAIPLRDLLASLDGSLHPLTAWRKAAGWSQSELDERAGLRHGTVRDIENGHCDPTLSTLEALAAALRVRVRDIVE